MEKEYSLDRDQKQLIYTLTYKDVVDILQIIDHSTCRELNLEVGDLKMTIVKKNPVVR
jgi:hypothetical protein